MIAPKSEASRPRSTSLVKGVEILKAFRELDYRERELSSAILDLRVPHIYEEDNVRAREKADEARVKFDEAEQQFELKLREFIHWTNFR